jgi:hypothetical protein
MLSESTFLQLLETAVTQPGSIHTAYSAFYGYSIGNQMLALAQCIQRGIPIGPIATFIGWKEKGRHVLKGAKAIALCMPVTCKAKGRDTPTDDDDASDTGAATSHGASHTNC